MMNKNFNIVEQHAEKIALVIAVAGAAYMIWIGSQDLTTTEGTPLDRTEDKVTVAVRQLHDAEARTSDIRLPAPNIAPPETNKLPLPPGLANFKIPTFLPRQAPVQTIIIDRGTVGTGLVQTPKVGLPTNLAAVSWRGAGAPLGAAPAAAGAGAPAATMTMEDIDLVVISGTLPISAFVDAMKSAPKIEDTLPAEKQIAVLYRAEVQRRVKTIDGWGSWVNVQQPEGLPEIHWPTDLSKADPTVVAADIAAVSGAFQRITEPLSYIAADGKQILLQVLNGPAKAALEQVILKPGGGPAPAPAPAPVPAPAPAGGPPPAAMPPGGGPMAMPPGFVPPAGNPPPAAAPAAPANNDPPCWIVERRSEGPDALEPNREYQYRVRAVMVNPTYNYSVDATNPGHLADEKMRNQPLLFSDWAVAPATVVIKGDMYFWITDARVKSGMVTPTVGARIYKWTGGHWLVNRNVECPVGAQLTTKVALPDGKSADVATGYTIIDVDGDENKVKVTLLTPGGELIVRDSTIDRIDQNYKDLEKQVWTKPVTPSSTTKPKTGTGPTAPPGPPPNVPGVPPPPRGSTEMPH